MRYLPFVTLLAISVAASPAQPANACNKVPVNLISGILKAIKATSFCSEYIKITPSTTIISQAKTSVTSYTSTTTDTQYEDTVTSTLLFQSTDVTTTTGTSYVSATETQSTTITAVLSTSTSTNVLTAFATAATPTATRTITSTIFSYYLKRKRNLEERNLEERKLPFPTELIKMAASDISQGCSCLGLPTPTVTSTALVTSTVLAVSTATTVSTRISTASSTTTITNYIQVLDVESTTITIDVTSTIPSIAITTTNTTSTSTITPAASTTTVFASTTITTDPCDPTKGTKYLDEVYNFNGIFHSGYDTTRSMISFGQIPLSDCCRRCFQTPGCAVATTLIGAYGCYVLVNAVTPLLGQSATCPTGLDFIDIFTGRSTGLPAAQDGSFVVGPCFAGTLRN